MTETLLMIIASLLAVICILGVGIFYNVSQAKTGISSLIQVTAALHDVNESLFKEGFESTKSNLEQLIETSIAIEQSISEIKDVTDVIYRYKLPNAAERQFLDQIEIDNEVSNGILSAGERQP
jgi:cell division protein FtsX